MLPWIFFLWMRFAKPFSHAKHIRIWQHSFMRTIFFLICSSRRQLYLKMDDFVICANCFIVFFTFLPVLNLQYVYLHVFDWPGSRVSSTEYHTTWYAVRMTVKTSKNLSINSSIRLRIQWRVMNDSNLPEFFFIIHKQEKYHF